MSKYVSIAVLAGFLLIAFTSCSDNGVDFDENPPSVPELSKTDPNVSYFFGKDPDDTPAYTTFNEAQDYFAPFLFARLYFEAFKGIIQAAAEQKPEFENDRWVWKFSGRSEEMVMDFRLTANSVAGGIVYTLYATFETENRSYEDVILLKGRISNNRREGSWIFKFVLEADNQEAIRKIFTTEWIISGESESVITIVIFDTGNKEGTYTITKEGAKYKAVIDNPDDKPDATIFWNSSRSVGYIMQNNTKRCWNSSLQNTPCSEVGL